MTNGNERMDRIEANLADATEKLNAFISAVADWRDDVAADHRRLLTAQVLMSDKLNELTAAQKHTDETLGILMRTVDEIIRGRKP